MAAGDVLREPVDRRRLRARDPFSPIGMARTMKKLPYDPRFEHVNLQETNLRLTFMRVRRQQAQQREAEEARKREAEEKVRTIRKKA